MNRLSYYVRIIHPFPAATEYLTDHGASGWHWVRTLVDDRIPGVARNFDNRGHAEAAARVHGGHVVVGEYGTDGITRLVGDAPPPIATGPNACGESTSCPDDTIRPCVCPRGHGGYHDAGVR